MPRPGAARDVDDPSAPRRFHPRRNGLRQKNAPLTLTSKMLCHSAGDTSSSGRPVWPSTPPALLTRTSTRPVTADASSTNALDSALVSHVDDARAARAASRRAESLCLEQFVLDDVADPHGGAALRERERDGAAEPCAAPVTMTVLPLNSNAVIRGHCRQRVERLERLLAHAALDVVDELDEPRQ